MKRMTVGDLARYYNGRAIKPHECGTVGLPIIRIANLNNPTDPMQRLAGAIKPEHHVRKGDLLVSWSATLDAFIWPGDDGVLNQHIFKVYPNEDVVTQDYLYFLLKHKMSEFRKHVQGATMQHIVRPKFEGAEVLIPPLTEQRRVAGLLKAQLAAVEKARRAAAERVKAAGALDGAVLREVFADAANGNWPMQELGEVAAIAAGIQKQPDRAPRKFHRPFLTVRNVQRGRLDLSQVEHFEITPAELDRLRLEDEDILVVEGNGSMDHIGRNALFQADGQEWIHQNHIIRVRMDRKRALPRFISYYLNSSEGAEQMLEKARTSSGLYTLSSGKVSALEVPLPPLKKQREVVERIEGITQRTRSVKSAAAAELSAIEALPGRLLREVFG